jgi:hypothetical protein
MTFQPNDPDPYQILTDNARIFSVELEKFGHKTADAAYSLVIVFNSEAKISGLASERDSAVLKLSGRAVRSKKFRKARLLCGRDRNF